MAQSSVAREPSMEEILASIRRIIESNEPNGEAALSASLPSVYHEEELDEGEDEAMSFVPDVAANDPGFPAHGVQSHDFLPEPTASVQGEDRASQTGERALSLADVAARVRAASARQQENPVLRPAAFPSAAAPSARQPELRSASVPPRPIEAHLTPAPAMPTMTELRPSMAPAAPVQRGPSEPAAPAHVQRSEFFAVRETAAIEPMVDEPVSDLDVSELQVSELQVSDLHVSGAAKAEPTGLPAKIEEAANLLSAEAGAQVAKSFNELAAVFNGLEHRSVEEMAQEMLRPMLQEWLDDNLPTLVERLVREEIERVARGPRR